MFHCFVNVYQRLRAPHMLIVALLVLGRYIWAWWRPSTCSLGVPERLVGLWIFHDFLDKPPILVYIISDCSLLMAFYVSDGSLIESWCLLERFEMLS